MRGLKPNQIDILTRCSPAPQPCGEWCTKPHNVLASSTADWDDVVKRGLISPYQCAYEGRHWITTATGRLALQLDTAARNLDVNKDWCI